MRRKLACVSLAEWLILLAFVAIPLDASFRPSFDLDPCSWNATHIVLVQTTANESVSLGKAGTVALPEILQVLDKPPGRFYDGDALIRVFVEAAGKDSGTQLHARLRQDVIYWKTVGPTLTQDWLGQLIEVGSPLFVKFNETSLLVRELDKEHYAPAAQTAAELREAAIRSRIHGSPGPFW